MNLTVPMQRGGAKSLPAEIKSSGAGHNPWLRMRMSYPGYGLGESPVTNCADASWADGSGTYLSDCKTGLIFYRAYDGSQAIAYNPNTQQLVMDPSTGLYMRVNGGTASASSPPTQLNAPTLTRAQLYRRSQGLGCDPTDPTDTSCDVSSSIPDLSTTVLGPTTPLPDLTLSAPTAADIAAIEANMPLLSSSVSTQDLVTAMADAGQTPTSCTVANGCLIAPTSTPPTAPSGYQWAQVINAAGKVTALMLAASQPGAQVTTLPNGSTLVYNPTATAAAAAAAAAANPLSALTSSGMLIPLLLIGGLFLMMNASGGKR